MTRVAVLSGKDADNVELTTILGASPKIKITELRSAEIGKTLNATVGDLLLLNVQRMSEDEIELLESIRGLVPDMPLIVLSPQLQPDEMRRLLKFAVFDWLPKPINSNDLLDSIVKGTRGRRVSKNSVHAVISAVGGAGASTVAVTMADVAAAQLDKSSNSVALFDLDFSLGSCGAYSNLPNAFNLSSVAAMPRRVDAEFIRAIQKRHEKGFYVYSFKRPELNGELNGYELVLRMLDAVSFEHEQTFVDLPYYMTDWRDDVLSAVNTCTLVTELNIAALHHVVDQIEHIRELRGKDFPVQVVINKWESSLFGQRVGRKQLRQLLEDVPFTYFPADVRTIGEAVDRGLLPSEIRKRSKLVRAVKKYFKQTKMLEEKVA